MLALIYTSYTPVGSRTRSESTAARLPLQGSKAIGLGHSCKREALNMRTLDTLTTRPLTFLRFFDMLAMPSSVRLKSIVSRGSMSTKTLEIGKFNRF